MVLRISEGIHAKRFIVSKVSNVVSCVKIPEGDHLQWHLVGRS